MMTERIKVSRWAILTGVVAVVLIVPVFVACSAPPASNPPAVVQPVDEPPTMPPVNDPIVPPARDSLAISQVLKATPETQTVIAGVNQFALDFYAELVADDPTANQFFSPWSIATAFALAGEGAQGQTADEIWDAFGLGGIDPVVRREAFKAIADAINRPNDKYDLAVANSFWQRFAPPQEYTDIAKRYYNAEVFDLPTSPDPINEWAAANTNGKIKEVIKKIDSKLIYLIVNALYFKGTWQTQFDKQLTQIEIFWTGNETITVPLMRLYDQQFNYVGTNELQAIELPYVGGRVSMLVILPQERDGLKALEQSLNAQKLASIKGSLHPLMLDLILPKFELEITYDLKKYLPNLGIDLAFDDRADFSGLGGRFYIGKAIQKAFVEVNEEGTEAAAVTVVDLLLVLVTPPPPQFRADHPFIFLIQDNETGNILFMGKFTGSI